MRLPKDAPRAAPGVLVWRQVPFSVEAFDLLKDWQRYWERSEARRVSNGEALDRIILAQPAPR